MPTFPTPPPLAAALIASCEKLFAMIEQNPQCALEGERLIVALLDAAKAQDLGAVLLVRRLRGRLADVMRLAAGAPSLIPARMARHG